MFTRPQTTALFGSYYFSILKVGISGTTFHPRHTSDPAGTEDLDGSERPGGVPHKDEVGVETMTDSRKVGVRHCRKHVDFWCPPKPEDTFHDLGMERPKKSHF